MATHPGIADTRLYPKLDTSKPEAKAVSLFEKVHQLLTDCQGIPCFGCLLHMAGLRLSLKIDHIGRSSVLLRTSCWLQSCVVLHSGQDPYYALDITYW